jgi:D-aminoacyl-tRNA deacylase
MRLVIQRVLEASVSIDAKKHAAIKKGLLVLIGIEEQDKEEDIDWLAHKMLNLRIFGDENGKMNHSLLDINAEVLLVSQFTLFASTKKGNRPSFTKSANPTIAIPLYEQFIKKIAQLIGNEKIKTGIFGADMQVSLLNDGPVTLLIDSKNRE